MTPSSSDKKPTPLLAATFTPITPQGGIDLSVIGPYVDYLIEKQGIKSIFVNGTTGESMSLSVGERKALAEAWCQQAKGKMDQVIVHVGCMSLKDCQELARHAAEVGCDGIAAMAPSFFKPSSADVLRTFLQQVAAAAPDVPFYYYHLPFLTGVHVRVRDLLEGIETLIPSFRGMKLTNTDLMDLGQCVSFSPSHWSVLYGVDEQLLGALAMGAHGAVGSTFNYVGRHVREMVAAFEKGDLTQARAIQFKLNELLGFAFRLGFDVGVNKQLMAEVSGLSLGPPRLPLLPCPPDRARAIADKYHSLFAHA